MENIKNKINTFYSSSANCEEGAPDSRYKSWEWCHKAFLKHKSSDCEETVDYLSLQLAFYLASWGMYRGSSFLLQRDYKAHKNAVRIILESKYNILWDFDPSQSDINKAAALIFDDEIGLYYRIKNSYNNSEKGGSLATDTLVTKILLGTYGCIPAFDRYLKSGISIAFKNKSAIEGHKIVQNIDNGRGKETFIALSLFCKNNICDFNFLIPEYPPMKCLDMYLWEIGYELDLAGALKSSSVSDGKKKKAVKRLKQLGFDFDENLKYSEISNIITKKITG